MNPSFRFPVKRALCYQRPHRNSGCLTRFGDLCRFLFDKACATYKYYDARVQQLERARGMAARALQYAVPGLGSVVAIPPKITSICLSGRVSSKRANEAGRAVFPFC